MAERFGGPHSPKAQTNEADNAFRGRKARKVSIAARLMYLAPVPLLFAGLIEVFAGNPLATLLEIGGFGVLLLGAWLLNEGLDAQAAYDERKVARPPAIPRKLMAALAFGLGVGMASLSGGMGLIGAGLFGVIATGLSVVGFGLDPMKRKGMDGVNEFDRERVARAVDKAEGILAELTAATDRLRDRPLKSHVDRIARAAREMFRAVEEDPRDLTRARKFMTVYLTGAKDATVRYADLAAKRADPEARAKYEALLTDLEASFTAHRETLLLDDRSSLDVEIEVLRERLQREGVPARQELNYEPDHS